MHLWLAGKPPGHLFFLSPLVVLFVCCCFVVSQMCEPSTSQIVNRLKQSDMMHLLKHQKGEQPIRTKDRIKNMLKDSNREESTLSEQTDGQVFLFFFVFHVITALFHLQSFCFKMPASSSLSSPSSSSPPSSSPGCVLCDPSSSTQPRLVIIQVSKVCLYL